MYICLYLLPKPFFKTNNNELIYLDYGGELQRVGGISR